MIEIENDFIEIGGGYGELSDIFVKGGLKIKLFIEPDLEKFQKSRKLLKNITCLNVDIAEFDPSKIIPSSNKTLVA